MNHTTSLEVSKRLKEAGYEGESQAAWYVEGDAPFLVEKKGEYQYLSQSLIPAYTLGELIRELPNHHLRSPKFPNGLFSVTNWATRFVKQATTPEDAAGLALEALLKKGI